MSVRQAQREIDSREFAEWLAFYQLEPYGQERHDLNAGIIAATIANVNRSRAGQAYKPSDFMPTFRRAPQQNQSTKQMFNTAKAFARAHNEALAKKKRAKANGGHR